MTTEPRPDHHAPKGHDPQEYASQGWGGSTGRPADFDPQAGALQGTSTGSLDVCEPFQFDISCLVDGELDEAAASRAVAHLESCSPCRAFFEDTRLQLKLHLDMADPARLVERYAALTGTQLTKSVETIELVERLTAIFYQLGKAYVLSSIDQDFRTRVFEPAVQVEATRIHGRGFIDGVVSSGRGDVGGVDWADVRHSLNGRLSRIEGALEKGTRLLQEALAIDAGHEEARLYLAYVHVHEGRTLRAAGEFKQIFDSAIIESNRGHAAVQLALLYRREGEFRQAIRYQRWVTLSGLADAEPRFFFVRFNIGVNYAHLGDRVRALGWWRELLDRHPDRLDEIRGFFEGATQLRELIDAQPDFAQDLLGACPELFDLEGPQDGAESPRVTEM